MGQLREKMRQDLKLKGYRRPTEMAYVRCARNFAAHYRRSPAEMGEAEVRGFILHQVEIRKVRPATHRMHVAALKFLYNVTLGRPEVVKNIPWPKVPRTLPEILTGTEVETILSALTSIKHRAILMTAYGAGLRISEVCALSVSDIDSTRGLIHVREGKGGKDRYVMLSDRLLAVLREYWRRVRPPGPHLFPGQHADATITPAAVRLALKKAVAQTDLKKRVTPHRLRHAFATHLLETGADLRVVQALLGHSSAQTTERYVQVSKAHVARVSSPLDLLGTRRGQVLG